MNTEIQKNRELSITKLLDKPVELVWKAWTDPQQVLHWWAPDGFTTTVLKMDVQEGQEWLLTLRGPDGKNYPNKSIYKEIIPLKKIVYEHFNPGFIATVNFEAQEGKTVMEWRLLFETEKMLEIIIKTFKADEGLKQNVEKLERYLSWDHFT